jgi:hypothetical protein
VPRLAEPRVMGLLQNQWLKDPARIPRILELYERHADRLEEPPRNRFIRDMLFFGCPTGRNLRKYLGEDLCGEIVWEEVSPRVGDRPSSVFPPDAGHLLRSFKRVRPDCVVMFGRVASSCVLLRPVAEYFAEFDVSTLHCCHPAARNAPQVARELAGVGQNLRGLIADG